MKLKQEVLTGSGCASSPDILIDDDLSACGKCQFCTLHLNPSTSFKSTVTNDFFPWPNRAMISKLHVKLRTLFTS